MKNSTGELIRKERERQLLSKEFLADKLEMSLREFSNIEEGLIEIESTDLYATAEVLKVSIYDLIPRPSGGSFLQDDCVIKEGFSLLKSISNSMISRFKRR